MLQWNEALYLLSLSFGLCFGIYWSFAFDDNRDDDGGRSEGSGDGANVVLMVVMVEGFS